MIDGANGACTTLSEEVLKEGCRRKDFKVCRDLDFITTAELQRLFPKFTDQEETVSPVWTSCGPLGPRSSEIFKKGNSAQKDFYTKGKMVEAVQCSLEHFGFKPS